MSGYHLYFRNLDVLLPIGLHDFEQAAAQRVLIDVVLHVAGSAPDTDDPDQVFDYDRLHEHIRHLAADGQILLQETLCARIIAFCQAQPDLCGAVVRTAKPDVYPDVTEVGCCLTWGTGKVDHLLALCYRSQGDSR